MPGTIPTPKMSEILWEEFMEPMGVSAYKLAQAIHVPTSLDRHRMDRPGRHT